MTYYVLSSQSTMKRMLFSATHFSFMKNKTLFVVKHCYIRKHFHICQKSGRKFVKKLD